MTNFKFLSIILLSLCQMSQQEFFYLKMTELSKLSNNKTSVLNIYLNITSVLSIHKAWNNSRSKSVHVIINEISSATHRVFSSERETTEKAYSQIKLGLSLVYDVSLFQVHDGEDDSALKNFMVLIENDYLTLPMTDNTTVIEEEPYNVEKIAGPLIFVVCILVFYSLSVIFVLFSRVKPRQKRLKGEQEFQKGDFLLKSMEHETVHRKILQQLGDKEFRAKAWAIYRSDRENALTSKKYEQNEEETLKNLNLKMKRLNMHKQELARKHMILPDLPSGRRYSMTSIPSSKGLANIGIHRRNKNDHKHKHNHDREHVIKKIKALNTGIHLRRKHFQERQNSATSSNITEDHTGSFRSEKKETPTLSEHYFTIGSTANENNKPLNSLMTITEIGSLVQKDEKSNQIEPIKSSSRFTTSAVTSNVDKGTDENLGIVNKEFLNDDELNT